MVAKIGPATTLAVGNTDAKRPAVGTEAAELEEGPPFLGETTMPSAEDREDAPPLEAEDTEDPRAVVEPRPELGGRSRDEEDAPLMVKFAHERTVMLAQ